MGRYAEIYTASCKDPTGFWREQAQDLDWFEPPSTILGEDAQGRYRWFPDGTLNMSHLALDCHVLNGRGGQVALIYDSPAAGIKSTLTYAELLDQVARTAGMLRANGVETGDRVMLYMPMIPEAVIAMLACARLGAIHTVVFGGFSPHELAIRIDDAKPKVLLTASCGIEFSRVIAYKPLIDDALLRASHPPQAVVVLARPQAPASLQPGRDLDWAEAVAAATPAAPVPVPATHPLYILHTSGTTGKPKGVVRDTGGYAVALNYSMHAVYDMHPGEVFWAASDVGWVVGHSYIVYAPLIRGCATVVYEGKPVRTPDAGAILAGNCRARRQDLLHRTHRIQGGQEGRSGGTTAVRLRHQLPENRLSRRGAPGPPHLQLDQGPAEAAGNRSLVADRDRLAHRRQSDGCRAARGEARLIDAATARLSG
jgi:propionyl-CoA synthetase